MPQKALVIQGGGFKTAFTAGVLDAFIVCGYDPFDVYAGVSGGANALSYFLANHYKKCIQSIYVLLEDPRFMGYKQFLRSGNFMDLDFFEEIAREIVQLDLDNILLRHRHKTIGIVATDRNTGEPVYLRPKAENWISCCIASCALPFITKAVHTIDGQPFMDGSWSDPLPVKWAVEQGAKEVILVRTSSVFAEKQALHDYFGQVYYKKQDPIRAAIFSQSHIRFNESIDFIMNPPEGVCVHQIAPMKKLKTGVYTNSKAALEADYRYGLETGLDFVKGRGW